jgi:hypothetical protein
MKRLLLVLTILGCFPLAVCAVDTAVNAVARAIESSYGMKQTHLPWIARATMKPFMKGSGVSTDFVTFEHQRLPDSASLEQLQELTQKALGPEWSPFVRSESHKNGERTLIFVKFEGKHMLMLIVSAEHNETTVIKLKMDESKAAEMLKEKAGITISKGDAETTESVPD